ncbi:MAG: hypothetical protein MZV63_40065 [Marinilabiliales bacterium]|nr:hypothetical protein [Marinilabiliales bacterium]
MRKGGAAARAMLVQAAADAVEGAGRRVHGRERRRSRTRPTGRTLRYGKVAAAAAKLAPPTGRDAAGPEGLEDRRQAAAAPRHPSTRCIGKPVFGVDVTLPGMLHAVDRAVPGVRRQGEERRRRRGGEACAA